MYFREEVNRDIYVCSLSATCWYTSVPVELVSIEPSLRPLECFSARGNFVVNVDDTEASLNATEWLLAEPFSNSQQTSLSRSPVELERSLNFIDRKQIPRKTVPGLDIVQKEIKYIHLFFAVYRILKDIFYFLRTV